MTRTISKNILAFFLFLFALSPISSFAFDTGESAKAEVRLIAEVETIQPGQSFFVAIEQTIIPHWHTYWKNPGDSGLPTKIKWNLPSGATAGKIVWPTPYKQPTGDLINYGYSDEVLLLTEITPPDTLLPGSVLNLTAKVSWLACDDICIPESAQVNLSIPVTDQAGGLSQYASKFDETRKNIARDLNVQPSVELNDAGMTLVIDPLTSLTDQPIQDIYFYNDDGLSVPHASLQEFTQTDNVLRLNLKRGDRVLKDGQSLTGVLAVTTADGRHSFNIDAQAVTSAIVRADMPLASDEQGSTTLWSAILLAFLGGIALNLMPCVFPILSMKALSLVKHAHADDEDHARLGAMMYLFGVLASFTALAVFLITLRAAGEKVGWGVQLQSPSFVLVTAYVLFLIGYALSGALNVGSSLIGVGSKWAQRHGLMGSFFTGVLAVIVATPCTAPFMGAAVFYALTQPWHVSLIVIDALGVGLALPYLILAFSPRLLRFLPKPGAWMEYFKEFLAFPMFGAAIWLVWVLSRQVGSTGVLLALSGMGLLSFGLWTYGTLAHDRRKGIWHAIKIIIAVASILMALSFTQTIRMVAPQTGGEAVETSATWEKFTQEKLEQARADNKPVFVNMTAAWCITCLANERVALSSDKVKTYFKDNGIVYLKGDWTNRDPVITKYLKGFGRSGVPIYVYYPPAGNGVVFPQLLTPDSILSKIKKAGL